MKFKPSHTTAFMLTSARNEADGYFELTRGAARDTPPTSQDHVSVTIRKGGFKHLTTQHIRGAIQWRRGGIVVTGQAIADTLNKWREHSTSTGATR